MLYIWTRVQVIFKKKTESFCIGTDKLKLNFVLRNTGKTYKHLKKSNAACFYTPVVLKLLIIVQMWKQYEEGN